MTAVYFLKTYLPRSPTTDPLTPLGMEMLQLLAQGLVNQEIANKLFIGEATVRWLTF